MNTKTLGQLGEEKAREFLEKKGFKILETNFNTKIGEIDIIALEKQGFLGLGAKIIHFVEVKSSVFNPNFFPEDRVDFRKKHKIEQISQIWLNKNRKFSALPFQFDVISINFESDKETVKEINFFEKV
ncbi:MAG: YraN family protein [bacterium]|nr:YraN family protein [bacterium]